MLNTLKAKSSKPLNSLQCSFKNHGANLIDNHNNKSNNDTRDHQLKFNQETSKNLEKMLNKIQKSFDPFKLKDENLKFSIVKEILECQRLLLTVDLSDNKENKQKISKEQNDSGIKIGKNNKKFLGIEKILTTTEIYDEWKILAMIVDRICFFVYLLALLLSSGLFFFREKIYNNDDNG